MGKIKDTVDSHIGDKVIDYPAKEISGSPVKDAIYNWVVGRYKKHNHPWTKGDQFFFHGFIYGVGSYVGYAVFVTIYWFLLNSSLNHFGEFRTLMLVMLLLIMRINMMNKNIAKLSKAFE